jgi:hypothetical protein
VIKYILKDLDLSHTSEPTYNNKTELVNGMSFANIFIDLLPIKCKTCMQHTLEVKRHLHRKPSTLTVPACNLVNEENDAINKQPILLVLLF